MSERLAAAQYFCFISGAWLEIKTLHFKVTRDTDWHSPLGEGLTVLWPMLVYPRKVDAGPRSSLKFIVKCNKIWHHGLCPSAGISVPMLVNKAAHWHLPALFSPEKPVSQLPNAPKQGNFSLCDPGDPQTTLPPPKFPPFFSTRAVLSPPGMTLVIVWTSKTSDFVLHSLYKLVVVSSANFPSQWF